MGERSGAARKDMYLVDADKLILVTDEKHPLYDERVHLPVSEKLVKNILARGVIKPVIMNGVFEVVDGRQRVKAVLEANKKIAKKDGEPIRVPAIIRRGTEDDLYGVLVTSNALHQEDGPLALAEKVQKYENYGKTEEETCTTFGIEASMRKALLKLMDCVVPVKNAVETGKISVSAAAQLGKLKPEEQRAALDELLSSGGKATFKKAAKVVAAKSGGHSSHEAPPRKLVTQYAGIETHVSDGDRAFALGAAWARGVKLKGEAKKEASVFAKALETALEKVEAEAAE